MENNTHSNLVAYNSYEKFDNFESLEKYRISKLLSCDKHVELLRNEFKSQKLKILELGSGHSKVLVNLWKNNILERGWGIEISKARFEFAQKWIEDLKIGNIENINDDLINFDYDLIREKIDACICVDLCFQFLEPVELNSSIRILEKIYEKLNSNGKLILELDYCGYIIENLPYTSRVCEEFTENDPWKYFLCECSFDKEKKILNWKKTFISKENNYDTSSIFLKIYSRKDIESLLNKIGFKNIRIYKDWNYTTFDKDFGELIIIAEK